MSTASELLSAVAAMWLISHIVGYYRWWWRSALSRRRRGQSISFKGEGAR